MSSFRFRFDSILKLREADRRQRRAELAEAFRAEALLAKQGEQIEGEIREMKQRARVATAPGRVDIDKLLESQRYELILQSQASLLAQRGQQLKEEIERRREALVEADRAVRVLEKLRDQRLSQHVEQELKLEQKQLDEVAQRPVRGSG